MTDIKKKQFFFLEFHRFRFKSAIPRIPRLFRDRGKSLALPVAWEIWPPKLWEFRPKRVRLPTFEPSYLRNEWPNIHKTGIDGQAIWQGFQIYHSCSDWIMFGSINLLTFVMTMQLTLWITWFLDDLSPTCYLKHTNFRGVIFLV